MNIRLALIISCLSIVPSLAQATKWQQILERYSSVMTVQEKEFFTHVQKRFAAGEVPVIAAPEIIQIPIIESGDGLIDLKKQFLSRIEMLPDPENGQLYASPTRNAGHPNASKIRCTLFDCLALMLCKLDDLAGAFDRTPGYIAIKVFEGLRDINLQRQLFNGKVQQIQAAMPGISQEDAQKEASKWISPVNNNVPAHSTGAAIDFGLWCNNKSAYVDMGILGTIWEHNPGPETFSDADGVSDEQKINRLYCLLAAHRAGLTNYFYEFWHYSVGDRYDAYFKQRDHAVYGAVGS